MQDNVEIADHLRDVFLKRNKNDSISRKIMIGEFFQFGFKSLIFIECVSDNNKTPSAWEPLSRKLKKLTMALPFSDSTNDAEEWFVRVDFEFCPKRAFG